MTTRLVLTIENGLVVDLYSDSATEVELLIVDHDADDFADDDDDRVSTIEGRRVWISGHEPVIDPWYVSTVFGDWQ
jgi:hypothetical protein